MKNPIRLVVLSFLITLLSACASPGSRFEALGPAELQGVEAAELCQDYHKHGSAAVRTELERRDLFSSREWRLIDDNQVSRGMGSIAAICAWGKAELVRVLDSDSDGNPTEFRWDYNTCEICNVVQVFVRDDSVRRVVRSD